MQKYQGFRRLYNTGIIKENKIADLLLIDLKRPELTPHTNLISNLVYSANGCCIDTTICEYNAKFNAS